MLTGQLQSHIRSELASIPTKRASALGAYRLARCQWQRVVSNAIAWQAKALISRMLASRSGHKPRDAKIRMELLNVLVSVVHFLTASERCHWIEV